MKKSHERRRILLVDRKTQLKYVALVVGVVLGINALIGLCIYFSVWSTLSTEYSKIVIAQKIELAERIRSYDNARAGALAAMNSPTDSRVIEEEADLLSNHLLAQLKAGFKKAQTNLIPIILLLLLVIVFEGIAISNRIVGPIYHAQQTLEKLSRGDLTIHTYFRKKDEFKSLYQSLNVMTELMNHRITALKRQLIKISDSAEDLKKSLGHYNPEMATQVGAQAEQILKRVADCNHVLAQFTVAPEKESANEDEKGKVNSKV